MQYTKRIMILAAVFYAVSLPFGAGVFAETYQIDPGHSTMGFAVKHLMVSIVRGNFTTYSGAIQFDRANPESFNAEVSIDAQSINTNVSDRDKHLKSPDFFDVEKFSTITFKSKKLVPKSDGYDIVGDLTMKGVTKEMTIPVWISGPVKSPMGADVIGLSGEATINRQDFGVSWNKKMDQGGAVVDDNVKIIVEIEAHKK